LLKKIVAFVSFCFLNFAMVAAPFSYELYGKVLLQYVDANGFVNYEALNKDRENLDRFAASLANLSPQELENFDEAKKLAFWINAYNALTLKVILDHYPIKKQSLLKGAVYPNNSIRQIPGVWDKIYFPIAGAEFTLDQIEHEILRVEFKEPRIHMALVCAAAGCPFLRREPFVGERLDAQLTEQTQRFLSDTGKTYYDPDRDFLGMRRGG